MFSKKYGRTYHYPFSPGTTSDDRIQHDYWACIQKMKSIIHTEKLDGENNCLNKYGVFARSHATPTTSPWTSHIRQKWDSIKNDLDDIELFGENIYAIHSIEYKKIEHYYYVFGVRILDQWLGWDEVKFYAEMFDFPTVPELGITTTFPIEKEYIKAILDFTVMDSSFESIDTQTSRNCTLEGVVSRNIDGFHEDLLGENVFKFVRKGHVKTDEHWTRNWKRAKLYYEYL
jgi:RNA ligase